MMLVVRTSEGDGRVGIAHWWPGKGFISGFNSPFPAYIRRRAYRRGSKYMTMAYVELPGGVISTYATCCKKDHPTRAQGRFIALLRLARILKSMGLKMERRP